MVGTKQEFSSSSPGSRWSACGAPPSSHKTAVGVQKTGIVSTGRASCHNEGSDHLGLQQQQQRHLAVDRWTSEFGATCSPRDVTMRQGRAAVTSLQVPNFDSIQGSLADALGTRANDPRVLYSAYLVHARTPPSELAITH